MPLTKDEFDVIVALGAGNAAKKRRGGKNV
jgi:hypothetical protein